MAINPFNVKDLGKTILFDPNEMGYRDSVDVIKEESVKIQKSFVKIGWYLKHIQDNELYREDGYANISECAAEQFGYSQSTVSRFIGICEKFSKNHNSPELDEKYAGFDKSHMIEMLPMSLEQLEEVKPDMTVRQIRDLKERAKEKATDTKKVDKAEESAIPGQTSIEEDFPEYMPEPDEMEVSDTQDNYATSHREQGLDAAEEAAKAEEGNIVDGIYKKLAMPMQETIQPKLPLLKNNDERKSWLRKYQDWGLWYQDENIDVNYYKFDFDDGSRLIVTEYPQRLHVWSNEWADEYFFHLLENRNGCDKSFRHEQTCETYLIDFLKRVRKKQLKF